MKMRYLVPIVALSIGAYAGGDFATPVEPEIQIPQTVVSTQSDNSMFAYIALGVSTLDISKTGNLALSADAQDDKGSLGEVGLGYKITDNLFTTLSLQRTMLDDADIDNAYVSLNYQFSDLMLKPYIGALVGYSKLKWSNAPYPAVINQDLTSTGLMFGGQAGLELSFNESLSVFTKYQYIQYDHELDIRSGATTLEHDNGHNILLGVQYAF